MTEYRYTWVRIRTRHAAGPSDWQFREVAVPAKLTKKNRRTELDKWFKENLAADINDELNTMGEGWRGIDWDWAPLPRHRMANRIKHLKQQLKNLRVQIKRYQAELPKLPEQAKVEGNKQRCSQFPGCGCIKQFKMPDCKQANEWQLKHLLWLDKNYAKKDQ